MGWTTIVGMLQFVMNLVSMKQCEEPESIRVHRDREKEGIVRLM